MSSNVWESVPYRKSYQWLLENLPPGIARGKAFSFGTIQQSERKLLADIGAKHKHNEELLTYLERRQDNYTCLIDVVSGMGCEEKAELLRQAFSLPSPQSTKHHACASAAESAPQPAFPVQHTLAYQSQPGVLQGAPPQLKPKTQPKPLPKQRRLPELIPGAERACQGRSGDMDMLGTGVKVALYNKPVTTPRQPHVPPRFGGTHSQGHPASHRPAMEQSQAGYVSAPLRYGRQLDQEADFNRTGYGVELLVSGVPMEKSRNVTMYLKTKHLSGGGGDVKLANGLGTPGQMVFRMADAEAAERILRQSTHAIGGINNPVTIERFLKMTAPPNAVLVTGIDSSTCPDQELIGMVIGAIAKCEPVSVEFDSGVGIAIVTFSEPNSAECACQGHSGDLEMLGTSVKVALYNKPVTTPRRPHAPTTRSAFTESRPVQASQRANSESPNASVLVCGIGKSSPEDVKVMLMILSDCNESTCTVEHYDTSFGEALVSFADPTVADKICRMRSAQFENLGEQVEVTKFNPQLLLLADDLPAADQLKSEILEQYFQRCCKGKTVKILSRHPSGRATIKCQDPSASTLLCKTHNLLAHRFLIKPYLDKKGNVRKVVRLKGQHHLEFLRTGTRATQFAILQSKYTHKSVQVNVTNSRITISGPEKDVRAAEKEFKELAAHFHSERMELSLPGIKDHLSDVHMANEMELESRKQDVLVNFLSPEEAALDSADEEDDDADVYEFLGNAGQVIDAFHFSVTTAAASATAARVASAAAKANHPITANEQTAEELANTLLPHSASQLKELRLQRVQPLMVQSQPIQTVYFRLIGSSPRATQVMRDRIKALVSGSLLSQSVSDLTIALLSDADDQRIVSEAQGHNVLVTIKSVTEFELTGCKGDVIIVNGIIMSIASEARRRLFEMELAATRQGIKEEMKIKVGQLQVDKLIMPSIWTTPGKKAFRLVSLVPSSREYKDAVRDFTKTCPAKVTDVARVENPSLYNVFVARCKALADDPCTTATTRILRLFHGSDDDTLEIIYNQGWDKYYAGKKAVYFGKAHYFARDAQFSYQYCGEMKNAKHRRMILALVVLKDMEVGFDGQAAPSQRSADPTQGRISAIVDNLFYPSRLVVYGSSQIYPAYVLTFNEV